MIGSADERGLVDVGDNQVDAQVDGPKGSGGPSSFTVEGSTRVFTRKKMLIALLIPVAMSLIVVSSVNVALATIGTSLHASDSDLQWVLTGYVLAFGILLVPSGRLGDLFGRSTFFMLGLALFTLGSLWCGLATSPLSLNVARIVQGIGAGVFNPQVLGIIQQFFRGHTRAKAFALIGAVISASVAIGPVIAGTLIHIVGSTHGWRAAFLFNVPLGLIGLLFAAYVMPFEMERKRGIARKAKKAAKKAAKAAAKQARKTRAKDQAAVDSRQASGAAVHQEPEESTQGAQAKKRKGVDIDPLGALLLATGVVGIMAPFILKEPWPIWLFLPAGSTFIVLWVVWERAYLKRGKEPMVDLALFQIRSFAYGTGAGALMFLAAPTIFVVILLYLQQELGQGALAAGAIGLPNALASGIASLWAARAVLTRGRRTILWALSWILLGIVSTVGVVWAINLWQISHWWLLLTLGIAGIGQGAFGSCNQTLSMQDVPPASGGVSGAVKQTAERVATAVGTAIVTGICFAVVAWAGWTWATTVSYGVMALFLLVALTVAAFDLRREKRSAK
ncbi:MAG: MFS transporter [Actinomycetaceae bacterium]|nr:MFS transporter [Actinomycetaceae bacterium]